MYYSLIRSILFRLNPEEAHRLTLKALRLADIVGISALFPKIPALPREIMGLQFPNPIGLAAGLDKNGEYIHALSALGFGFIEVGTLTPKPQIGNPSPRVFRLPEQQAIINRLGFNNKGVDNFIENMQKRPFSGILGVNIGKSKTTPIEYAIDDYLYCFRRVYPLASYVTINISSPNTENLRELQRENFLQPLLNKLKHEQTILQALQKKYLPIVVKISPDLSDEELEKMADIFVAEKIDGVIATNTTISRAGAEANSHVNEAGGMSGKPLFNLSLQVLQKLKRLLKNQIPLIGCGGITDSLSANAKFAEGADLIQLYTGLIYEGPGLIKTIRNAL